MQLVFCVVSIENLVRIAVIDFELCFSPLSSAVDRLKGVSLLHPFLLGDCNCLVLPTFLRRHFKQTEKFQNCESMRELNFIADIYLRAMPYFRGDRLRLSNCYLLFTESLSSSNHPPGEQPVNAVKKKKQRNSLRNATSCNRALLCSDLSNIQQIQNEPEQDMKNSADGRGCYNTLQDLENSTYSAKAEFTNCFVIHSKHFPFLKEFRHFVLCLSAH